MNLDDITPLVLTYNEEPNIARTLAGLSWARQILIVDSGSTDRTLEIASASAAVTVIHRDFDNFAAQCNFGLQSVSTEWTLSIDADYMCGPELATELAELSPVCDAYMAEFVYAIYGRQLRGTLYPPRPVLFRPRSFRYIPDGHAHQLDLGAASCGRLRSKIVHDDRKPLARWLESQSNYVALEVDKLLGVNRQALNWKDRLRRGIIWAPPLTMIDCLFRKGLILDGWPGIFYALQRVYVESLRSLKLLDARLSSSVGASPIGSSSSPQVEIDIESETRTAPLV